MGETLSRAWRERQELAQAMEASRETYREHNDLNWSRTYREGEDSTVSTGWLDGGGAPVDRGETDPQLPAHFDLHRQESSEERAAIMQAALEGGTAEAEEEMCSVCWGSPKVALTLPCMHCSLCANCAEFMFGAAAEGSQECPVCRAAVESVTVLAPLPPACAACSGALDGATFAVLPCGHTGLCAPCAALSPPESSSARGSSSPPESPPESPSPSQSQSPSPSPSQGVGEGDGGGDGEGEGEGDAPQRKLCPTCEGPAERVVAYFVS